MKHKSKYVEPDLTAPGCRRFGEYVLRPNGDFLTVFNASLEGFLQVPKSLSDEAISFAIGVYERTSELHYAAGEANGRDKFRREFLAAFGAVDREEFDILDARVRRRRRRQSNGDG